MNLPFVIAVFCYDIVCGCVLYFMCLFMIIILWFSIIFMACTLYAFALVILCGIFYIFGFEKEAKRNSNARAALEMVSQLLYSSMFVIGFRSIKLSQLFASRRSVFAGAEPVSSGQNLPTTIFSTQSI